jgi:hypothetical protein
MNSDNNIITKNILVIKQVLVSGCFIIKALKIERLIVLNLNSKHFSSVCLFVIIHIASMMYLILTDVV